MKPQWTLNFSTFYPNIRFVTFFEVNWFFLIAYSTSLSQKEDWVLDFLGGFWGSLAVRFLAWTLFCLLAGMKQIIIFYEQCSDSELTHWYWRTRIVSLGLGRFFNKLMKEKLVSRIRNRILCQNFFRKRLNVLLIPRERIGFNYFGIWICRRIQRNYSCCSKPINGIFRFKMGPKIFNEVTKLRASDVVINIIKINITINL